MSQTSTPLTPPADSSIPPRSSFVVLGVVLVLLFLLVRLPGLMVMPIFGDEAIYLRWADLVRAGHPWVCLVDPKPPLHFWLLAAVVNWTADPLAGARGLSVVAGLFSILAGLGLCMEIAHLIREPAQVAGKQARPLPEGRSLGLLFAVLMIFCPFLAFYQRLATADALFILELLTAVWMSLRWSRRLANGAGARGMMVQTVLLGLAMAAAMLTRQGLSYTLWGMPVAAYFLHARGDGIKRTGIRGVLHLAGAGVIAGVLWIPYLRADMEKFVQSTRTDWPLEHPGTPVPTDSDLRRMELKRRVLYQSQFTESVDRLKIARDNSLATFIPTTTRPAARLDAPTNAAAVPVTGWFYFYLTPGVYAAGILGLVWLCVRRQWLVLGLLLAWLVVMLAPVLLLSAVIYSRYTLAGAIPLLLAGAYLVTDLLGLIFTSGMPKAVNWSLAGLTMVVLGVIPMRDMGRQSHDWENQTLTERDRYQYITGWPAGQASQRAIQFLSIVASESPITVITDHHWGTPSDALWVYLSRKPNVRLYYISWLGTEPILQRAADGTVKLRADKWLYTKPESVRLSPEVPVLFLTHDPLGDSPAVQNLRKTNPNLPQEIPFYGVGDETNADRVLMFYLR